MAPSQPRIPRAGGWLVALPAAGAVVLLSVLALGWVQTQRSAELVLRGEAALLVARVARDVRNEPGPLTDEFLRRLVAGESRAGLLFAALVGANGEVIAASSSPPPPGIAALSGLRPGDVRRDGNRAWARTQGPSARPPREAPAPPPPPANDRPPPRDDRPPRPHDRPPPQEDTGPARDSVLVLFEPRLVTEIDRAALATLVAGVLGALGLVGLGLLALRLLRRNEESLRRLEKEERLASLGAMSAVVAHELRNPLAALKGHAQLLVESLDELPPEKAQAQRVVDGAVRLERLSASLLELARTGQLAREASVPAELVRTAVAGLDPDRVRIDAGEAPATWSLDPLRFQQVVSNLVENALQAAPGRSVDVRVATHAGRLLLEVRDHGPGVPEPDRERIFEPFVTTRARGVGLGLAVARQIVALHGGSLSVADAPGGGACFRVELPAR